MKDQCQLVIDADTGEVIEEDKLALTEPDSNQEEAREAVLAAAKLLSIIFRF